MNIQNNLKARVFLSCGQREKDEIAITDEIALKLQKMGFELYIAVREQTLRGFTENILPGLDESEYYIFIDFKREQLIENSRPNGFRGSLFSHQELAIATYLKKPVIAFQEKGLKSRDGIVGFLQMNPIPFEGRKRLPGKVETVVKDRNWSPMSRGELILNRRENEHEFILYGKEQVPATFYHIEVTNLHNEKSARNCTIYLKSIKSHSGNKVLEPVEIKWKGMNIQQALIPPKFTREFDGVVNFEKKTKEVYVGINHFLVDYSGYPDEYKVTEPGVYELEYVVFSENFRPVNSRSNWPLLL
jgi:hypothetical protein